MQVNQGERGSKKEKGKTEYLILSKEKKIKATVQNSVTLIGSKQTPNFWRSWSIHICSWKRTSAVNESNVL